MLEPGFAVDGRFSSGGPGSGSGISGRHGHFWGGFRVKGLGVWGFGGLGV